jgi:hypothetical protein
MRSPWLSSRTRGSSRHPIEKPRHNAKSHDSEEAAKSGEFRHGFNASRASLSEMSEATRISRRGGQLKEDPGGHARM